jgi:hypothetical protein
MITIGASTNSTYNNLSNGSYTNGWVSTLSGITSTVKVSMTHNGSNILALRSYNSSISTSVNSGSTWSKLTGTGLPTGTPGYTTLAQSATGQYQLVSAAGLGLFYSANYGASFTASALNTTTPYVYLHFDNFTVTDMMGNVTPSAVGPPTYTTGQVGTSAVSFGSNTAGATPSQYILAPWTGASNFTASFWFNLQALGAIQTLFSAYGTALYLYVSASNVLIYSFPTGGGTNGTTITGPTLTSNTWYYVTIIFQTGSTCSLYLNGAVIGTYTNTSGLGSRTTSYFALATYDASPYGQALKGYIDDFRLYTSAVTAANNPLPYFNNVAVSGTGQYMYATANNAGGLWSSSNYGVNWTQQAISFVNSGSWNNGLVLSNSGQYVAAETTFVSPQLTGLTASTWTTGGVTWTATAVSNPSYIYYAFNNALGDSSWNPSAGNYVGSTSYSGGVTTTVSGIGSVSGDWLQLQASVPLVLYSYSYGCGNFGNATKSYVIAGSNDGSTWYAIQSCSIANNPFSVYAQGANNFLLANVTGTQQIVGTTSQAVTCTSYSTSSNAYTYFRIIGTLSFGNYFQIGEWPLNFIGGHMVSSNFGSTWSLTPYPATTITPNSASATSSSWTANNVTWTVNQSSTQTTYYSYYAFNNAVVSAQAWASTALYNTTTGAYSSGTPVQTVVLGGVGTISGEWLQIQSSIPLVMYNYTFSCDAASQIPKTFYLVGSTDGTNWYPIQYGSFTTNPFTTGLSTATSYIRVNQSGSQTIIGNTTGAVSITTYPTTTNAYTYFRMIWVSIWGSNFGNANMAEWYINFLHPTAYPSSITNSGNGQYALVSNNTTLSLMNNYFSNVTSYTLPTLSSINAPINCASVSSTGQYMVVLTQGTTNNVYYSTNYGSTFTALSVGSSAMTSCAISYDGSYIAVSNATTVYTLNTNSVGYAVSIGNNAGNTNQAINTTAIGNQAGVTNQSANSIVLNATGSVLNAYMNGFFIGPIASTSTSSQTTVPLLGYGADSQITTTTIYANSNGYVGIGTNFPNFVLHIHNNTAGSALPFLHISGSNNSGNTVGINLSPWYARPGGTPLQILGIDDGSYSAHVAFMTAAPGAPGSTTASERMRITSSGYVGIGTNAPGTFLDIQGYIQFGNGGSTTNDCIQFTRGTTTGSNPLIQCQTNYVVMYSSASGTWTTDSATGDMIFRNSSANFIWNNNAGGYSAMMLYSSPANILRIGPAYSTAGSTAIFSTTIPSTGGGYATADGARIVFNNTYNGTAGAGMAANKIVLHNNNWIAGFGIETGSVTYHSGAAHTFYINTNNTSTYGSQALIINGSGNVGIGSSSPQTKLDVNGNIRTNITYNQLVSHSLVSGTNTSAWYKCASFTGATYTEFLFTWQVGGEHGQIRFIVSTLYNNSPNITIVSSSYFGGPAIQAVRLALDSSNGSNTHYIEYYTNSVFSSTVVLNCYVLSTSPTHNPVTLVAIAAGTSSGYSYYTAWLANAFQINPSGKPVVVNYSGYLGVGTTSPVAMVNIWGGTTILGTATNNNNVTYVNPCVLHLRGPNSSTVQQIWECVGQNTCGIGCSGIAGLSYGVQVGSHLFRVGCTNSGDFTSAGSQVMTIGSSIGIGTASPAAPFHCVVGSKIVLQNSQEGGSNRGIFYWNDGDTNWVGYMSAPGGGRSASNGTACTGAFGMAYEAIRNRVSNYSGQGFIWENSNETCLMSIRGDGAGGGVMGQWGVNTLSPSRQCSVNGTVGTNDWLYMESSPGMWWSQYGRGFASPEETGASYGHCIANGYGRNGWKGWGVGNNAGVFMTSGDGSGAGWGIHDNQNTWAFYVPSAGTRTAYIMGSVMCSQGGDRFLVFNNGYDTSGGYFYYNYANGYGMASDERIKKNIEVIPFEQSKTFITHLDPAFFCLKQEPGEAGKHCAADGTELSDLPTVCNCEQSGFIAQNVLAAAELADIPKSVCNNWYEYEQELNKPDEERKSLLGVSIVPVISHSVNVVKHNKNELDKLNITQMKVTITQQADMIASLQQQLATLANAIQQYLQTTIQP